MLNNNLNQKLLIFIVETKILNEEASHINCLLNEDKTKIKGVSIHFEKKPTTKLTLEEINQELPS